MKLSANDWAAISAAASAISTLFAAVALIISARQTHANTRATSFAAAQAFSTQCRDLWKECRECGDDSEKFKNCLSEILASFELFCLALSDLEMSDKTRSYISETIFDYLSAMQNAGYGIYVSDIVSKSHVCKELKDFAIQHRASFTDRAGVADMLGLPRTSLI
jgi:hypothetical protein